MRTFTLAASSVLLQEHEDPALLSAAAHALLQRSLLDAEGAIQLLGRSGALPHLLGLPAAMFGSADAAVLEPGQVLAAQHAFCGVQAAASLVAMASQLAPAGSWAEVSAGPGLLAAAASSFSRAASFGCGGLPDVADPAVRDLRQAAQASLAPLADALALLADATGSSPAQLEPACGCSPLPLAAAVAVVLSCPELRHADGASQPSAACCRLLAVMLMHEEQAASFLLGGTGEEHTLPLAWGGSREGGPGKPVGTALCTCLMELWLQAAAADGSSDGRSEQQQVLHAALGGLLAFSRSAKQVALDAGLHSSLLDGCRSLGAGLAAPAARLQAQQAAPTAAAHRAAKLQQLRETRRGGSKQPAAALAFGSRVPVSGPGGSRKSASRATRQASAEVAAEEMGEEQPGPSQGTADVAADAEASTAAGDSPSLCGQQQHERQPQSLLIVLLSLQQQLAYNSSGSSRSLAEAGAMDVAATLWGAGGPDVQASLLSLLAVLLHNSPEAWAACASTGEQRGKGGIQLDEGCFLTFRGAFSTLCSPWCAAARFLQASPRCWSGLSPQCFRAGPSRRPLCLPLPQAPMGRGCWCTAAACRRGRCGRCRI